MLLPLFFFFFFLFGYVAVQRWGNKLPKSSPQICHQKVALFKSGCCVCGLVIATSVRCYAFCAIVGKRGSRKETQNGSSEI